MTNYYINKYLPQKQDLIWIDFEPSVGKKIKGGEASSNRDEFC